MGYYDQTFLNYYYYMASQFALSDRWFSPVASKSTPNRIATVTGGTTQGLVYDPFKNDDINTQLNIPTIFGKLSKAGVSWRIYYGITNGGCTDPDGDCGNSNLSAYPSITFADFTDSYQYLYVPATKGVCSATTTPSGTAVGDMQNAFCIDTSHIVPLSQSPLITTDYFHDIASGVTCTPGQTGACMPSFAFVEPAYGHNDEHPGSGQSILPGQAQVASMISGPNGLMNSPAWNDSVFFLSYDEGGGPFDHVPPVPGHTNDFSNSALGLTSANDVSTIAVNPDTYFPCPANGRACHRLYAAHGHIALRPCFPWVGVCRPRLQFAGRGVFDEPGIWGTAWLPVAEYGDLSVHQEALCFAHPDGPHGHHQVRGRSVYR